MPIHSVHTGQYDVIIGEESLSALDIILSGLTPDKTFVLVDENSNRLCLSHLLSASSKLEEANVLEIPSGEIHKHLDTCRNIWSALSELGASRKSLLINLGGGVVTDMGGFCASVYKRGINFINVPTTLLSQVDASVGGKTGVDMGALKNEIGTFADPKLVLVYPRFLNTLPKREILSGFAECVKHALIADAQYWKYVKEVRLEDSDLTSLIIPSVEIKNSIVLADPFESGERKKLNFGHTAGHAIEGYYLEGGQKSVLHGEAVVAGMIIEVGLSFLTGLLPQEVANEICSFLVACFKPVRLEEFEEHRMLELMRHDKKNSNGKINFTLLGAIGDARINKNCEASMVKESFKFYREQLSMWS